MYEPRPDNTLDLETVLFGLLNSASMSYLVSPVETAINALFSCTLSTEELSTDNRALLL